MPNQPGEQAFSIFLVDDDGAVLKALSRLLRTGGYHVQPFSTPQDFLEQHDSAVPGCAVLDVAMPGLDGFALQAELTSRGVTRPVIFLTGKGDIPLSVRAMRGGAIDFLTKPIKSEDLFSAIARARVRDQEVRLQQEELLDLRQRLSSLTPREHEVMVHVIAGRLNKQIAFALGTVEKTIKVHRGRMMEKMGVRSVAELVRLADKAGVEPFHPQ